MIKRHLLAVSLAVCLLPAMAAPAAATNYPDKTITINVPFPPGGGTDALSRLISQSLSEQTGWNTVAENRPGAGGTIGVAHTARANPDGYQLVMGQVDNLAVAPWLLPLSYDPLKDFTPIANVATTALVVVTYMDSPYQTFDDLITAAKTNPGKVDYASPGTGTITHLAAELLQDTADIKLQHIPYRGSGPAMADLLGKQIPIMFTSVPAAMAAINGKQLRPLAVTSPSRSPVLPDVPTIAESGYDGFDVTVWYGLLAPANTPDSIVQTLNKEVNVVLKSDNVQKTMSAQGIAPIGGKSEDFRKTIEQDYKKWEPIAKASGAAKAD